MPFEDSPIGVGIIGPARQAHYIHERISRSGDLVSVVTCSEGQNLWESAVTGHCPEVTAPNEVIDDPRVELGYFSGPVSESLVAAAILKRKHLILEAPIGISATALRSLADSAITNGVIAAIHQPRHWSEDFLWARQMVQQGLCGRVERVRLAIHERAIPGDVFPNGVLRDIGFHYLDQLLMLVQEEPRFVSLRRFSNPGESMDHGFLAVIDFADGASAVVELQTRSSLSLRTGWLVEGNSGAYRAGRSYSRTPDGEIIDEPLPDPIVSADRFLDLVSSAIRGNSQDAHLLPDLTHAARVVDLIDKLEQNVH